MSEKINPLKTEESPSSAHRETIRPAANGEDMKTKGPSSSADAAFPANREACKDKALPGPHANVPDPQPGPLPVFTGFGSQDDDDSDEITPPRKKKERQKMNFAWVPGIFIRPKKTIQAILEDEKPNWLLPMLILSIAVIISVVLMAPAARNAIQSGLTLPKDFEFWSQEEQAKYFAAQQNKTSPTFLYAFPALSGVAGMWIIWTLTANILHLVTTLAGSRTPRVKGNNLVAWAMLPFALGLLVKGIASAVAGATVSPAPLAEVIPAEAAGFMLFLRAVLAGIDAYWVWHAALLLLAAAPLTKLAPRKAFTMMLIVVLIMLVLQAVPGMLSNLIANLTAGSSGNMYGSLAPAMAALSAPIRKA